MMLFDRTEGMPGRRAWAFAWCLTAFLALGSTLQAQTTFKPLDRGDYNEVEQKLVMLRGLEAGGSFALRIMENHLKGYGGAGAETQLDQDFRLRLRSVFNETVSMNLTLETVSESYNDANIRANPPGSRGRAAESGTILLSAREAYLQYRFNPRSAANLGKRFVELGDLRGKTFEGNVLGFNFDCEVGTWCMPFGMIKVGPGSAQWTYHWALTYNAWDEERNGLRHALNVSIFRIIYTERNIPLGKNLGPTCYDAETFDDTTTCGSTQATDDPTSTNRPIFYDADAQNYYGLRFNWEGGALFLNFDITANQGKRDYHMFRKPEGGVADTLPNGNSRDAKVVAGVATEMELGYRWPFVRAGLRFMEASGDECVRSNDGLRCIAENGDSYLRGLEGYYEITPGTYRGARLYFNGSDSAVSYGSGLGHSVNNTRLFGAYVDYADRTGKKFGYSGGLYQLTLNNPIPDAAGKLQDEIGLELDNMFTWFMGGNLQIQLEANLINTGKAFRIDDYSTPISSQDLFVQAIGRVVYEF